MPELDRRVSIFRYAFLLGLFAVLTISANAVIAHGSERGLVLLLPSKFYIVGGVLTVAATFLLMFIVPARWCKRWARFRIRLFPAAPVSVVATSLVSFGVFSIIMIAGLTGTDDPLTNPLPIFVWTLWWVIFTIAQGLTGNLWYYFNPWSGPAWLIRKLSGCGESQLQLPQGVGYLPAIILFSGFIWFQLISLAPEDPTGLGYMVALYWALNMAAILIFGEPEWLRRGEPFSVIFRLIGSLAPFQIVSGNRIRPAVNLVCPGAKLVALKSLPLSGVLFVLITLSSISFDGVSKTFIWLQLTGVNPLEFPGRSAVMVSNSIGLVISFMIVSGVYLGCVYLGCLWVGGSGSFLDVAGKWVYAIIPISLAFHCAHYLTHILVYLQYAVVAFNDPFALGWSLFNAYDFRVSTSFFNHIGAVEIIWKMQTGVIVLGHIVAVWVAHAMTIQIDSKASDALKRQLPLALLMIVYTAFGLWLLSTASIG